MPAVKHMPGHGRATADSHAVLPRVETSLAALRAHDFVPFRALRDAPAGLTSHVCYTALDAERPGTLSKAVINEAVRGAIGFDGLLFSDDLSMGALTGPVGARAAAAVAAGCDLALHCNGKRAEMEEVVAAVPLLTGRARERFDRMQSHATGAGTLRRDRRPPRAGRLAGPGVAPVMEAWLLAASVWVIPVLFAITLHEAAHGWAALKLGDDTAKRLGRVTLNPIRHVHPVGTILLPGALIALGAPFVFGFAKPVPVNPARLRNPRGGMVLVALAGPGMNILLACVSAVLLHAATAFPASLAEWWRVTFTLGIVINLVLAIFNMLPVPPLDGGRVVHGLLPPRHAERFARLERFGIVAVLVAFFIVPLIAAEFGSTFSPLAAIVLPPTAAGFELIVELFGVEALVSWSI